MTRGGGEGARWAAALALAAGLLAAGAAGADSWLSNISRNLRAEMAGVLELATVNYSTPVLNSTFVASVEFDMRAMGPVYNSTHYVIDAIANKQAYPEGMVEVADGHVELAMSPREDWRPLLTHYGGPLAVAAAAALLVAVLPLAGVLWCCCYWWRGGRRRRPFDRKFDSCVKALLAILLIGLLTLFLFGVVCAFATDSQVESGSAEAPDAVRAGIKDARTFLNETQAHARWLLVVNWRELERRLAALLTSSGLTISVQLGEFSRAVSVTTLNSMVSQLDAVAVDLRAVRAHTASLRVNAERLNAALRAVRAQLLRTLAGCDQPQCRRLQEKHRIGQLDTEIHYSQMLDKYFPTMPDVSELLNNVTSLLESNIQAEVAEGQQVFRDIQREIQRSVDEHIPLVQDALTQTGHKLEGVADEITYLAGNASAALQRQAGVADSMQQFQQQYGPYRRHAGRAAAAALLAITCVLAWGLVCGVCGKRPDVYGASDCCNKGAGSQALLCGMCLMFVVGGCVAAVLLVYFAAGLAAQRFLCDPLTEPRGNRLFSDVEKFVELEKALFNERSDPDFNMTYVLLRCHQNLTVYKTFQLHRLYDLAALRSAAGDELNRRVLSLKTRYRPPRAAVTILKPSARAKLRQLAGTGLSDFDFDKILHALETNITSLALDGLASQLDQAAAALQARPGFAAVANSLQNASERLARAQTDIVSALVNEATSLNATATRLRDGLRFNHSSLKEAIAYLMHETSQAEAFLNTQGPELIQNMTQEFAVVVAGLVNDYLDRVVLAAEQDVGRCGPLSHAFNATRDAHCHKILMPVNGYWMSLSWCVLLFVPMMVVAQRLARLYRNLDPYPGPLVEAEYLYDAYADRDNVPLANGSKRSTLDIEGKIAEWRERSLPSAPPAADSPGEEGAGAGAGAGTQLLLTGQDVVCALLPPAALIDDLKTRLPAKDEDNESGIHESDAYKAEKRSGREARRGGGGGGGGAVPVGPGGVPVGVAGPPVGVAGAAPRPLPAPAALDAHHARRYNDMAPKHWEEGPPRYLGPTEYERPPPYYYPGPADRQ